MKRIIHKICSILLLCGLLWGVDTVAAAGRTVVSYTDPNGVLSYDYSTDGSLLSVSGTSVTEVYDFTDVINFIKEKYGVTITAIGGNVFRNIDKSQITNVIIPASIQYLEDQAFAELPNLASFCYGAQGGLIKIGEKAFYNDKKLWTVRSYGNDLKVGLCDLPQTLQEIGAYAFCGTPISNVKVPEGIAEFAEGVFKDCSNLHEINYPASLTRIGAYAFAGSGISYVQLPDNVKSIGEGAYMNSKACFFICSDDITELPDNVFANSWMKLFRCPKNLRRIGKQAFENTNVVSIELPDSLLEIGEGAFLNAKFLTQVSFSSASSFTIGKEAFSGTGLTTLTLPHGCRSVGEGAFLFADADAGKQTEPSLTRVVFQNPETELLEQVFPDTTTLCADAESTAFSYSQKYGNPFMVTTLYEVPELAPAPEPKEEQTDAVTNQSTEFQTKQSLTTPSSAQNTSLPTAKKSEKGIKKGMRYTVKGLIFQANGSRSVTFVAPKKKTIKKLVVPTKVTINGVSCTVTEISEKACYQCKKLTEVVVKNGVITIGAKAFSKCKKLKKVDLGTKVKKIGEECFAYDKKFTSLMIRSRRLTTVGKNCMKQTSRKSIMVPKKYIKKYQKMFQKKKA